MIQRDVRMERLPDEPELVAGPWSEAELVSERDVRAFTKPWGRWPAGGGSDVAVARVAYSLVHRCWVWCLAGRTDGRRAATLAEAQRMADAELRAAGWRLL